MSLPVGVPDGDAFALVEVRAEPSRAHMVGVVAQHELMLGAVDVIDLAGDGMVRRGRGCGAGGNHERQGGCGRLLDGGHCIAPMFGGFGFE